MSKVVVKGVRELVRAADRADKETKKFVRGRLRQVAEPVLDEARSLLGEYDEASAARLGISVRRVGTVSVEQRKRRTTGQHPEFGRLQMREALVPALQHNADEIAGRIEEAIDEIADHFERR